MPAILSECGQYRYALSRDIDMLGNQSIAYFGVNPSTADASNDDSTVKKWIQFSGLNKASAFTVANAFAYRSTDVRQLALVDDPIGPANDFHIDIIINEADILIPCWGSRHKLPERLRSRLDALSARLLASGKPVYCFGLTSSGDPRHPLMLPYSTELIRMR